MCKDAWSRGRQVQVGDDDAVYGVGEVATLGDEVEVGKATGIVVAHVHAAIEHDVLATQTHKNTTAPHILARPFTRAINLGWQILARLAPCQQERPTCQRERESAYPMALL